MAKTRKHKRPPVDESRTAVLQRRARRHAKKGDTRKAILALRESVALEATPQAWTRLGGALMQARREREALDALRQAAFLFRREGMLGRARAVARMILRLDPADAKAARLAA